MSRLSGQIVLAVFAHPDDEAIACGGTIARLADQGARIVLMCASRGERGSADGPIPDDRVAEARARELRESAAVLGIAEVLLFDHPDGDLRWAHVSELHAQIMMTVRQYAPSAVITFGDDGLYWHVDHIGVHERTTTVLKNLGSAAPPLYYVTMPPGMMRGVVDAAAARGWTAPSNGLWSLPPDAFGDSAANPTVILEVTDWVPRKLAAIKCHCSQMAGHPFAMLDETTAKRWLGIEHFRRAPVGESGAGLLERLGAVS